ncbi:hypothetical protein [Streptomyces sp. SID12488]|nr:hypothetical protein [Streptomyces sp. SID12488]
MASTWSASANERILCASGSAELAPDVAVRPVRLLCGEVATAA